MHRLPRLCALVTGCVLVAGCRLGFDARDLGADAASDAAIDPTLVTTSVIAPVAGATELIPVALALTPDGGSVIAGSVDRGAGLDWAVARLDAAGQLDPRFGDGGMTVIDLGTDEDLPTALAVGPDGEIVVVGETFIGNGNDHDSAIVRLTPTGQLDPAFGSAGVLRWPVSQVYSRDDRARAVAIDALGRVLVAGYTNTGFPSYEDAYVARLDRTGAVDPAFAPVSGAGGMIVLAATNSLDGGDASDFPRYLGLDSQGRIVVALTCSFDACALRLTPDGEPDPAFGTGGVVSLDLDDTDEVFDAALQADDRLLIAGTGATAPGPRRAVVARLTAAGALDPGFGTEGVVRLDLRADPDITAGDAAALAIAVEAAGTIVVGGSAHTGAQEALAVVRLSAAGVRAAGFGGTYVLHGGGATARDLALDAGGGVHLLARAAEHAAVIRAAPGTPWPATRLPAATALPLTGPTPTGPDVTLADEVLASGASTATAPLAAGQLTITGAVRTSGAPAVFLHAGRVVFTPGAVLTADGAAGETPVGSTPGAGGSGASGGGAGAYEYSGAGGFGGRFGRAGISYGGVLGGAGFASSYARGFYYGRGGDGGRGETCCPGALLGGEAGNGGGGGGGGAATNYATQGGGGGGGLIVIVADTVTGAATLRARGGDGYNINGNGPGGGGGGVVWVAARSYDGALTPDVAGGVVDTAERGQAGTARMFQILADGTLVERAFTDAW